ncbi:zinc finger domain-containing protein [Streptomyces abikoensis]|uniref:DNA-binding phage zinc finger domain-containing protein n=1 Tax=Streptomyces abikoensis TaxID=97398 RepID=A0ABW7TCP9_9ACTN
MQQEPWGRWRQQFRSGEAVRLVNSWYRRVECPACNVAAGRACRTPSGYPTDHHRARRDTAGPPPYKEWTKRGLIPEIRRIPAPDLLDASRAAQNEFGIDQPIGDAVAIVRQVLADQLGIALNDETTLDRLDAAVRALALARGPEGSADVITVLASQLVGMLTPSLARADGDPDVVFAMLIRAQVDRIRRQQRAEQHLRPRET